MPIEVHYLDEVQPILLWEVGTSWTIEEFYDAHEQTQRLIGECDTASVIVDARQVVSRPKLNILPHFKHVLSHTNLTYMVYVGNRANSRLIETFINIVLHMNPQLTVKQVRFARSLEEAQQIVQAVT